MRTIFTIPREKAIERILRNRRSIEKEVLAVEGLSRGLAYIWSRQDLLLNDLRFGDAHRVFEEVHEVVESADRIRKAIPDVERLLKRVDRLEFLTLGPRRRRK